MSDLRKEIEKIFNKIDEDLQNDKENSMTIYDCFDFREEDRNSFILSIIGLINCGVIARENDEFYYSETCEECINEIIYNNHVLAQMIIEESAEQHIIDFNKCMLLCDMIDNRWDEYRKFYKTIKFKDIEELQELVENFNKKNNDAGCTSNHYFMFL